MSAKIMGGVFDLALTPAQQIVLLAYADHADHLGNNVFPSKRLIAWKTGYDVRQVQRVTKQLVEAKLMIVVEAKSGKQIKYKIDLSAGNKKPPFEERKQQPDDPRQDVTPDIAESPVPRQDVTPTPDMGVPDLRTNHQSNRHTQPSETRDAQNGGEGNKKNPRKKAMTKAELAAHRLSAMSDEQRVVYNTFTTQFGYQPEYDKDFETDIERIVNARITPAQLGDYFKWRKSSKWWQENRGNGHVSLAMTADELSVILARSNTVIVPTRQPASAAPASTFAQEMMQRKIIGAITAVKMLYGTTNPKDKETLDDRTAWLNTLPGYEVRGNQVFHNGVEIAAAPANEVVGVGA